VINTTRLVLLVANLAALAGVSVLTVNIVKWRDDAIAARACVAAVTPGAKASADPAKACPPVIAADHAVAVRARACDSAFMARPENTYGVAANCSAPVKGVQAERDVARREAGRLTKDLQTERLGQDAAIARAQAAATTQAERKARADAALKAAPRDRDGLVVCAADCLRARSEGLARERP
jgi:hypothetical protein